MSKRVGYSLAATCIIFSLGFVISPHTASAQLVITGNGTCAFDPIYCPGGIIPTTAPREETPSVSSPPSEAEYVAPPPVAQPVPVAQFKPATKSTAPAPLKQSSKSTSTAMCIQTDTPQGRVCVPVPPREEWPIGGDGIVCDLNKIATNSHMDDGAATPLPGQMGNVPMNLEISCKLSGTVWLGIIEYQGDDGVCYHQDWNGIRPFVCPSNPPPKLPGGKLPALGDTSFDWRAAHAGCFHTFGTGKADWMYGTSMDMMCDQITGGTYATYLGPPAGYSGSTPDQPMVAPMATSGGVPSILCDSIERDIKNSCGEGIYHSNSCESLQQTAKDHFCAPPPDITLQAGYGTPVLPPAPTCPPPPFFQCPDPPYEQQVCSRSAYPDCAIICQPCPGQGPRP